MRGLCIKRLFVAVLGAIFMLAGPARADEKTILALQWRGATGTEGPLQRKLASLGYKVHFETIDAQLNAEHLSKELSRIKDRRYDAIYTLGTNTTRAAMNVFGQSMPIVFAKVYDPIGANLVASLERPGGMVTGVVVHAPVEEQFEAFRRLGPLDSIIVLFNPREPNANLLAGRVHAWAANNGINETAVRIIPDTPSLQKKLNEIKAAGIADSTIVYGIGSYMLNMADTVSGQVGDKVRLYGASEGFVLSGWLAALAGDAVSEGEAAAEQFDLIFKGQSPANIQVRALQPKMMVNGTAAQIHKIRPDVEVVMVH